MNSSSIIHAGVVVMPLRFTDHVPQMRGFLTLLGFSSRVGRSETWQDMVGGSGMVALHSAANSDSDTPAGVTGLSFEVGDCEALAARFVRAGFADVDVYDEAYGRVVRVRDRDGTSLSFQERSSDLYGYRLDEPRPENGVVATAIQFGPRVDTIGRLLSAAGFSARDDGAEFARTWVGSEGGLVVLRPAEQASVRLGVRTAEPLPRLAERLTNAGHSDVVLTGDGLTVTDPDGQTVLVLPTV